MSYHPTIYRWSLQWCQFAHLIPFLIIVCPFLPQFAITSMMPLNVVIASLIPCRSIIIGLLLLCSINLIDGSLWYSCLSQRCAYLYISSFAICGTSFDFSAFVATCFVDLRSRNRLFLVFLYIWFLLFVLWLFGALFSSFLNFP